MYEWESSSGRCCETSPAVIPLTLTGGREEDILLNDVINECLHALMGSPISTVLAAAQYIGSYALLRLNYILRASLP